MRLENVIIPACVFGFKPNAGRFDIEIKNSVVAHIERAQAAPDSIASGTLLPCLAHAHVQIDKTYVVDHVGAADGDLFKAIMLMAQHRTRWTAPDITARMQRAMLEAYRHGLGIARELARVNTRTQSNTALLGAFVYRNADMHAKLWWVARQILFCWPPPHRMSSSRLQATSGV